MMIIDFMKPQERVASITMKRSKERIEAAKKIIATGFMLIDSGTAVLYDESLLSRIGKYLIKYLH